MTSYDKKTALFWHEGQCREDFMFRKLNVVGSIRIARSKIPLELS